MSLGATTTAILPLLLLPSYLFCYVFFLFCYLCYYYTAINYHDYHSIGVLRGA